MAVLTATCDRCGVSAEWPIPTPVLDWMLYGGGAYCPGCWLAVSAESAPAARWN